MASTQLDWVLPLNEIAGRLMILCEARQALA
jgi:hypothetical protein